MSVLVDDLEVRLVIRFQSSLPAKYLSTLGQLDPLMGFSCMNVPFSSRTHAGYTTGSGSD